MLTDCSADIWALKKSIIVIIRHWQYITASSAENWDVFSSLRTNLYVLLKLLRYNVDWWLTLIKTRQTEWEGGERGKKGRRGGEAVQGLWCCRTPAEWRQIRGLKACAGTVAAGQWNKQMWPWFTSAAYQRLLLCFNLTAMPSSYFLPRSLSLASFAHPDIPTYFCTPPCLGSPPPSPLQPLPTRHHPLQLDPHVQPELRCFNPLSVLHPPHTHTGMQSVNYLVHPLLHLHFRH